MINKRVLLKNIRSKWETPEKLLEYLIELDEQEKIDLELAYKKGMKETAQNYSVLFVYMLRKTGYGKKTLPLFIENINIVSKQLENGEITLDEMRKELEKIGLHIR